MALQGKYASFLFYLVSLWMLFQTAKCDTDVGELNCKRNFGNVHCPMNDICSGTCRFSCSDIPRNDTDSRTLWGTGIYTYGSSICKAATHDGRISTRDGMKRSFTLIRIPHDKNFWGSARFGIRSYSYGNLTSADQGSFIFVSPRVTEEILDVTSIHRNFLFSQSDGHVQRCYGAKNSISGFFFKTFVHQDISTNLPGEKLQSKEHIVAYRMRWPKVDGEALSGGFLCIPNETMLSIITSMAMSSDADFYPMQMTYVANINDTVTLTMEQQSNRSSNCSTVWMKDEEDLPPFIPQPFERETSLILKDVQEGSHGFYSLQCDSHFERRGIVRLIVRACPDDRFGYNCSSWCPECQNGGICHDITGVCICPPGFNGTTCEHACPRGYFGRACSMSCPKQNQTSCANQNETSCPKQNQTISCKGNLLCLPDPYGCSCGSGFKGIFCNESCSPGEFGAGCSQKRECHCSDGEPCDLYSGLCVSDCSDGWHGEACNNSYPVLTGVQVSSKSNTTAITLTFREWDPDLDNGTGNPDSYQVLYKRNGHNETWLTTPYQEAKDKTHQETTLENLMPGTAYVVKIVVIDVSGKSQKNGLQEHQVFTLCETPLKLPSNVRLSAEETEVFVRWEVDPNELSKCKELQAVVKYESHFFSEQSVTTEQFLSFPSPSFTEWNVTLCLLQGGGADYNGYMDCAETRNITTKEGAPGKVQNFSCDEQGSRSLNFSWSDPLERNGIIRNFILSYKQIGWNHNCGGFYNSSVKVLIVPYRNFTTVRDLNPSAKYSFEVAAFTVKKGSSESLTCDTQIDVPSAGPTSPKFDPYGEKLSWSPPPCNMSNGLINSYWVTIDSIDEWDKLSKNISTKSGSAQISHLKTYTKYNAKIFASTDAGFGTVFTETKLLTRPAVPPKPTNLTVYSQNLNSLSVAWLPPYPPNGKLDAYEVGFQETSCTKCRFQRMEVTAPFTICNAGAPKSYHCWTIKNLNPQVSYTIKIQAYNVDVRVGSREAYIIGKTVEAKPRAPASVSVYQRTEDSIKIAWEAPVVTNGRLLDHRANLTQIESSSTAGRISTRKEISKQIRWPTKEWKFLGLSPATSYTLTLEASTVAGYGPPFPMTVNTRNGEPSVSREPQLVTTTEDTITVKIFPTKPEVGPISFYFVVVKLVKSGSPSKRGANDIFAAQNCAEDGDEYVAARLESLSPGGTDFVAGVGDCVSGYFNRQLIPGSYYRIGLAVLSSYKGEDKYSIIKYTSKDIFVGESKPIDTYGIVLGILIFLIIVVSIFIFFFAMPRGFFKRAQKKTSRAAIIPMKAQRENGPLSDCNLSFTNTAATNEGDDDDFIETESLSEDMSKIIPVKELEEYVLEGLDNGEIRKQYKALPRGQKYPSRAAKISDNKVKNRYGNVLPYDHSRVKLKASPDDPLSDYINANYVSGYKAEKKYIGTQGPLQNTVIDFWKMIWKENTCKILMCTNLMEIGRVKCEKYWPAERGVYGNITVTLKHSEPFADYVIRTFEICNRKEKREIKHFHYITWPDHGTPMYTSPVVKFLKQARDYQPNSKAPIVVHCSAGVGRTGTLILLDSMLEMGMAEGEVDVCGYLCTMRKQRCNIVENLDQYIFVYKALVQSLCWGETSVLCADLIPQIGSLRTPDPDVYFTPLEMQYQRLSKICPPLEDNSMRAARNSENVSKNRAMEILPPEQARPILKQKDGRSSYINAVYVNGYREKDAFIATQYPLPNTISDFWRMIYDMESRTIVLLQNIDFRDPTCLRYWPSEGQTTNYEEFRIQCTSVKTYGDIQLWCLNLSISNLNDKNDATEDSSIPIKLFHHLNWAVGESLPEYPRSILDLIDKVEKNLHRGKHIVTVQCMNGSTACGVYCAAMFLCNKMINEQEVDIFTAVQNVRANRPQFIESFDQYDFLCDLAITFLDNFGAYANFL